MVGTILITGSSGAVGHDLIHYLSVTQGVRRVVGVDVDEKTGQSVAKEAMLSANFLGLYPDIQFVKLDLFDLNSTTEFLRDTRPDVICHTASLGAWWITRLLPPELYKKISPLGPWVPNHLTLTIALMKAIGKAGLDTKVVNGCFPDLTNVVLAKLGLAPSCGGGNMDHACNFIRYVVSRELKLPTRNVFVYGVGHHGAYYTARLGDPFYVKILVGDRNVSDRFPHDRLRNLCYAQGFYERPQLKGPLLEQSRTAASFLRNTLAIYFDTGELRMSVPGPNGLPGAYPCRLNAEGAEVVLPDELTLQQAIRINEEGARHDGIEKVKEDGTIVFLDENVRNMRDVLGYDCEEIKIPELRERAEELNGKLKRCYEKYGVK